jgi:hypothetical protein
MNVINKFKLVEALPKHDWTTIDYYVPVFWNKGNLEDVKIVYVIQYL